MIFVGSFVSSFKFYYSSSTLSIKISESLLSKALRLVFLLFIFFRRFSFFLALSSSKASNLVLCILTTLQNCQQNSATSSLWTGSEANLKLVLRHLMKISAIFLGKYLQQLIKIDGKWKPICLRVKISLPFAFIKNVQRDFAEDSMALQSTVLYLLKGLLQIHRYFLDWVFVSFWIFTRPQPPRINDPTIHLFSLYRKPREGDDSDSLGRTQSKKGDSMGSQAGHVFYTIGGMSSSVIY